MSGTRKDRLASLLHREIATTIQRELKDPRLGFVTITRVELTADLHQVRAYWSCLGGDKERRLVEQALEHARGFIQRAYAPVVKTRLLPALIFVRDDAAQRRQSMDALIRQARATDPDHGERPEPPSAQAQAEVETPRPG